MPTLTATPELESFVVDLAFTGLATTTAYTVWRRLVNSDGTPMPGDVDQWEAVGSWSSWYPSSSAPQVVDYEPPFRPFVYVVQPTSLGAPGPSWTLPAAGAQSGLVDFADVLGRGELVVRSLVHLGRVEAVCIYDMTPVRRAARGVLHPVLGSRFPVAVMDARDARAGQITFYTASIGEYRRLMAIIAPDDGQLWPVWFRAGDSSTLLVDDLYAMPGDVEVQLATHRDGGKRFVLLDFTEVDPRSATKQRPGDDDSPTARPTAAFTWSPTSPRTGQTVTFTSTSTGTIASFRWEIEARVRSGVGPHAVTFKYEGAKTVRLTVTSPQGKTHTVTATVTVRR
jgi:hypothetical protein